MKKGIFIFSILFVLTGYNAIAQYVWEPRNNFTSFNRCLGITFSIDTNNDGIPDLAYAGMGEAGTPWYSDLWQYNAATDTWAQMADIDGQRANAIYFSLDGKGYVGGGNPAAAQDPYQDFWQYDPATNTWIQKTNLPGGSGRWGGFAIGVNHKGYFGFGAITQEYSSIQNDFWEYDPIKDTWTQLNGFPSTSRLNPAGFSLDSNTIYLGTGWDGNESTNDFWAYSIPGNSWVQKEYLPASPRLGSTAFAANGNGFLGLGVVSGTGTNFASDFLNDFYEYSPATNNWNSIPILTNTGRDAAMAFTVAGNAYAMCGRDSANYFNDVYELVIPVIKDTVTTTICAGLSYEGYTASGTYIDTFTISNGVDSIRTLYLIVLPPYKVDETVVICQGQSYHGYDETGTYIDSLFTSTGCDSIYKLNLTVLPAQLEIISQTICSGQSYEGHSISGTYADTGTSSNGCDSVHILYLAVLPTITDTVSTTVCAGKTYDGHNTTGIYIDSFTSVNGCDSIRILNLTVSDYNTGIVKASVCEGDTFEGHTLPGNYYDTIPSNTGCDTINTLELNVTPRPDVPTITQYGNTLVTGAAVKYQWFVTGIALDGDTGQSLAITVNGAYSVEVWDSSGCSSSSMIFAYLAGIGGPNLMENSIAICPNPTSGQFSIGFYKPITEKTDLIIQDMTGGIVWHESVNNVTSGTMAIDAGKISKGVYILMIHTADIQISKKLVIE